MTAITNGNDPVKLTTSVTAPLLWTAETPNLYTLRLSLKDGATTRYVSNEKFGFRTIEVRKQDGIYLNGVKIKMKGVNRHVWWPETGRCVSPALDIGDVKLIKEVI